jgi:hypothetical protein
MASNSPSQRKWRARLRAHKLKAKQEGRARRQGAPTYEASLASCGDALAAVLAMRRVRARGHQGVREAWPPQTRVV